MKDYAQKIASSIRSAIFANSEHLVTEEAEVFVDYTATGVSVTARLSNFPDEDVPDATISVDYNVQNGIPSVKVKQRQDDRDVPVDLNGFSKLLKSSLI